MKVNLLRNTLIMAMASSTLIGCGGTDKGLDYNFSADNQVEFADEAIVASLSEVSGEQVIDLLQGASANGQALNSAEQTIFIREFVFNNVGHPSFVTPQLPGNSNNQNISPFYFGEDKTKLIVNTDFYQDALRFCDDTDIRGASDEEGLPIGDGFPDFPSSITYSIQYIVDNGFELPAGEEAPVRTLNLTISSVDDVITGVAAADVPVPAGGTAQALAQLSPAYACGDKSLSYSIADTSVATVDDTGLITGVTQGTTELTITSNATGVSTTATITGTPGFNIAVTNQEQDELGAYLSTKEVPSCSVAGLNVEPSIVNDDLSGAYTYSWMSENVSLPFLMEQSDGAFGATGLVNTGTIAEVGSTSKVTVGFGTGYTGATAAGDVLAQDVEISVVKNNYCDPGVSLHPAGFFVDFDLDQTGANWGGSGTAVANTSESLDGTSVQITAGPEPINLTQQVWNNQRNYHSWTYGQGADSLGKTYKFSVWAKLETLPAGPVIMKHVLLPWNCDGCTGLTGFPGRRHLAGEVTAELKATTDWQLVEFINPLTSTPEWTVPEHWNVQTAVFQFYEIEGIAEGDIIYLDEQAVVSVE